MSGGPETKKKIIEMIIKDDQLRIDSSNSGIKIIGGFHWFLRNEVSSLKIMSLHCHAPDSTNPLWTCHVRIKVKAIETDLDFQEKEKGYEHVIDKLFHMTNTKYTVKLANVLSEEEFEDAYKMKLRWEIEVINRRSQKREINFEVKNDSDDRTVNVGGKVLYVNKGILSFSSPYFKALFNSIDEEKKDEDIVLQGVEAEDFICLLHFIYPFSEQISDLNIEAILKVADKFGFPHVLDACQKFLLTKTMSSTSASLKLLLCADQYSFKLLKAHCVRNIKCFCQVRELTSSRHYQPLKIETKIELYEKVFTNCEECCNPHRVLGLNSRKRRRQTSNSEEQRDRDDNRREYAYRDEYGDNNRGRDGNRNELAGRRRHRRDDRR